MPLEETDYEFLIPSDKPWTDITQVPKGTGLSPGTAGSSGPIICEAWLKLCGLTKGSSFCLEIDGVEHGLGFD